MLNIFLFVFGLYFGFLVSSKFRLIDKIKRCRSDFRDNRFSKKRFKSLQRQLLNK